jgi:alanine transaminase
VRDAEYAVRGKIPL